VLRLVKEAKASAASGAVAKAVAAATEARLAIDGEALKNVSLMVCVSLCVSVFNWLAWCSPHRGRLMNNVTGVGVKEGTRQLLDRATNHPSIHPVTNQDGVSNALDRLLPELRVEVDKALRRLCSGKLAGGSKGPAGGFASADYAWILRAYLVRQAVAPWPCLSVYLCLCTEEGSFFWFLIQTPLHPHRHHIHPTNQPTNQPDARRPRHPPQQQAPRRRQRLHTLRAPGVRGGGGLAFRGHCAHRPHRGPGGHPWCVLPL
jgi:hypothetical protein